MFANLSGLLFQWLPKNLSQTLSIKTIEIYFLVILEAGNLKSKSEQGWCYPGCSMKESVPFLWPVFWDKLPILACDSETPMPASCIRVAIVCLYRSNFFWSHQVTTNCINIYHNAVWPHLYMITSLKTASIKDQIMRFWVDKYLGEDHFSAQ